MAAPNLLRSTFNGNLNLTLKSRLVTTSSTTGSFSLPSLPTTAGTVPVILTLNGTTPSQLDLQREVPPLATGSATLCPLATESIHLNSRAGAHWRWDVNFPSWGPLEVRVLTYRCH